MKKKILKHMLTLCNKSSPTDLITGHRHLQYHLEAIATASTCAAE